MCAGGHRDGAAGAGLGLLPSSLLKALPGHGTSGGRVPAPAHSHGHFLFPFILQTAAQSLNYSEQAPVAARWSRGAQTQTQMAAAVSLRRRVPVPRGSGRTISAIC